MAGRVLAPGVTGNSLPRLQQRSRIALGPMLTVLLGAAGLLGACSSSPSSSPHAVNDGATSTDPAAAVDAAVIAAWRGAENAFYEAEADPQGLYSPTLAATIVNPELQMIKASLAGDETEGFIGKGSWNLGSPRVVSLGPTQSQPTTATVVSCIDDSAILWNEHTSQPASGAAGTPDWEGETSTMILTASGWKLSQQQAVANVTRSIACAGIAS